jgi:hypothetical protein
VPTGACWLKMVEASFGILTRKSVRRGSFASVKDLMRHIGAYIEHWNNTIRPSCGPRPRAMMRKALRRGR